MSIRNIIYLTSPSKIICELFNSYLSNHFGSKCNIINDIESDCNGKHKTFLVLDCKDILIDGGNKSILNQEFVHLAGSKVFYIVLNVQRGNESKLAQFPYLNKVRGIFYADDSLGSFKKGLSSILEGEIWIPRKVLADWVNNPGNVTSSHCFRNLSCRELSVLKLVVTGQSNKEISQTLHISTNTVKVHLYNIFKKIDVSNRLQAARWAINNMKDNLVDGS